MERWEGTPEELKGSARVEREELMSFLPSMANSF